MTNGERLKYLREKKGLTQKDVATRLGLEPAAISKYELDMREPNIEALKKLATIFNVSIDYIITGEEKHPIPVPKMTDEYYKLISIYSNLSEIDRNYIMSLAERLNQK